MTEAQIATAVEEIIALAAQGKAQEVWEKFYHQNVEKTDFIDGLVFKGKKAVIESNQALLSKITAVRDFTVVGKVVKGNRSIIIWSVDFDVTGVGTIKATEVDIMDWQDGKIITQKFFA